MTMLRSTLPYFLSAAGFLSALGSVQAGPILTEDFANDLLRDPEAFSGGSTVNFWTNNGSESGGQYSVTVANTSGFTGSNKNTTSLSDAWEFFTQEITLSARGISFTDTSVNGKTLPLTNTQAFFGFGSSGNTAWAAPDGISLQIKGDGATFLRLSSDQPNTWGTTAASEPAVAGLDGFDLTLGPGTTGVDYTLTLFNDGPEIVKTGNFAIELADWDSAVSNTSRLSIQVQEAFSPDIDADQQFTFTLDSVHITATVPEPLSGLLLASGLGALFVLRRKTAR